MVDETIARLCAALALPGFNKRVIAELTGLHKNTFMYCDTDRWNPTTSTLRLIEQYLPPEGAIEYRAGTGWIVPHPVTSQADLAAAKVPEE